MCTNDPAVIQGQPITLHLYVKYATNGNMRVFFNYARLSTDPLHFVEDILEKQNLDPWQFDFKA